MPTLNIWNGSIWEVVSGPPGPEGPEGPQGDPGSDADVTTHEAAGNPHPAYALDTDLASHEADTTSIHGIADTSVLATATSVATAVSTHAGLADPHTGYVLESLIDAAADLLVGTADNTVGRLAKGSALDVLRVNAGATALEWAAPSGGAGTPAISVTSETTFGIASAVGSSTNYARQDHTHGSPVDPTTAHEAAGDPHTGYQKESEKGVLSGYAGLDANARVPLAQLGSGTATSGFALVSDGTIATWTDILTQAEMTTHTGAADPHTGYLLESVISGLATPAIVLGTAAAAGSTLTPIRSDATIAAFDATVPTTWAFGASAATGSIAFAARRDHVHGAPADPVTAHVAAGDPHTGYLLESVISGLATPAIILGTAAAAGSTLTPIRSDATIVAFDATSPSTQAFGDSAVVGTIAFAARRDHKHAMPANPVTAHEAAADPHTGYVLESLIDAAADLIVGSGDNAVARLAKGAAFSVLRVNSGATALEWAAGPGEDLVPFSRSGVLTVAAGVGRFRFPWAATLLGVTAAVNTAPTGASLIADVNKNGTTIFTTQGNRPTIAISGFATTTEPAPDVTTIAAGDYLTVDVDQIGSTVAGSDLSVFIRYRRT